MSTTRDPRPERTPGSCGRRTRLDALSQREKQLVVEAATADVPASAADVQNILMWAAQTRMDVSLLELILGGQVGVRWSAAEQAPAFWRRVLSSQHAQALTRRR